METVHKLINRYVHILKTDFNKNLITVALFGSAARKTMKQNSDIDILLIINSLPDSFFERINIIRKSEAKLLYDHQYIYFSKFHASSSPFDYIIFSKEEAEQNRYLYLDLIYEAKIFYDRDDFFANKLQEFRQRINQLGAVKVYLPDGTWYWDLKPDLKLGEEFEL